MPRGSSLHDMLINYIADKAGFSTKELKKLQNNYKRWAKQKTGNLQDFYETFSPISEAFEDVANQLLDIKKGLTSAKENPNPATDSIQSPEYSAEPYDMLETEAHRAIAKWWHDILFIREQGYLQNLPNDVLSKVEEWKNATIDAIGEENFVDLIQNRMGYHAEGKAGDIDFTTFFATLYDEAEHRWETDSEVASRIDFWIQQASTEAMSYIPEDSDMGDYDRIVGNIIDYLDEISF